MHTSAHIWHIVVPVLLSEQERFMSKPTYNCRAVPLSAEHLKFLVLVNLSHLSGRSNMWSYTSAKNSLVGLRQVWNCPAPSQRGRVWWHSIHFSVPNSKNCAIRSLCFLITGYNQRNNKPAFTSHMHNKKHIRADASVVSGQYCTTD